MPHEPKVGVKPFKPMLASAVEDVSKLRYPLYVSPKLDGVRAIVLDGVLRSRNGKPIANAYIQNHYSDTRLEGLDGELILSQHATRKDCFRKTSQALSTIDGKPSIEFHVFDVVMPQHAYDHRLLKLRNICEKEWPSGVEAVEQIFIHGEEELNHMESHYLSEGYEGAMLRAPDSLYKFGRSTLREGWLLKLKRFEDSEAIVLGMDEKMHNANEAVRNNLGHLERSSHKANLHGTGMMGALHVIDIHSDVEFSIGTGFDDNERRRMWDDQQGTIGKIVKYKFQPVGVKDKPRFPVFLGFRDPSDL